jgi:hypothetical protein
MARDEIQIPERHRQGARIYLDEKFGIVRIEQDHGGDHRPNLFFEPQEAKEVAAALIEVAKAAIAQRKERNGNS